MKVFFREEHCWCILSFGETTVSRSSRPEVFLRKGVLKTCSKFTGEHPSRSAISIKFLCNFIDTVLRHGCSPVNLRHIFWTSFPKNTSDGLLLIQNLILNIMFLIVIHQQKQTTSRANFECSLRNAAGEENVTCASVNGKLDVEVISMYEVPIKFSHQNCKRTIRTYAMLDNFSLESFIK